VASKQNHSEEDRNARSAEEGVCRSLVLALEVGTTTHPAAHSEGPSAEGTLTVDAEGEFYDAFSCMSDTKSQGDYWVLVDGVRSNTANW
jgi:hypothetical protein